MSLHARLMLFVLSALSTVIIPAVMVSLYHTIREVAPQGGRIAAIFGTVPLVVVMLMCFAGLYYSIFRVRIFPPKLPRDDTKSA